LNDLCVTEHDTDRRALPGLRLCPSCRDHLARLLADLPGLHDDLAEAMAGLTATARGCSLLTPGTTPAEREALAIAETGLPLDPAISDHRHQIAHDLLWWAIYVADERGISRPGASDPATTAPWLAVHVDWLSANPAAAEECLPVMRQLAGRARHLLDPDRRLPTGERCRVVSEAGERCNGTVAMVLGRDDAWSARCTACGQQEAAAYLRDKVGGRLVTIERVEAYALHRHRLRVARATIRSWALRGRVQTTEQDGVVWYDLGSVERYLSQRGMMSA
jgi:hypothetical protein